ncbi:hypothetical protein HPP92_012243 [Vanilla planifolia]|nr:hypothetical protein HPP92_012243 [Vanilla planifolia]
MVDDDQVRDQRRRRKRTGRCSVGVEMRLGKPESVVAGEVRWDKDGPRPVATGLQRRR